MPLGDGTGPMGLGPMTGRAVGYCAGYALPGYANPFGGKASYGGFGRGWAANQYRAFGRGRAPGFGRGRGRRRWGYTGFSYYRPYAPLYW